MTTAIIFDSSTKWGSGESRCILCGDAFTYDLNQKTIPGIKAPDLCPRGCGDSHKPNTHKPNTHKGGCAALGGDLCPPCMASVTGGGPKSIRFAIRTRIESLLREADRLTAYLAADEWKSEIAWTTVACPKCGQEVYRRPGEDPVCAVCDPAIDSSAAAESQ